MQNKSELTSSSFKPGRVAIVVDCQYPHGTGFSPYCLALGAGLNNNHFQAECLTPYVKGRISPLNHEVSGECDGVGFRYTSGFINWPWKFPYVSFLKNRMIYYYGIGKLIYYLVKEHHRDPFQTLIVSEQFGIIFPVWLTSRLLKVPVIGMLFEYPFWMRNHLRQPFMARWKEKLSYKLLDGVIAISEVLKQYYEPFTTKRCRYLVSPLMTKLFPRKKCSAARADVSIVYCGDMSGIKDDVITLIEAFDLAFRQDNRIHLDLIGFVRPENRRGILDKISSAACRENIFFRGFVATDELEEKLMSATMLVMPKADNLQNTGNFPSKLGLYLSTGRPVIASDVGSISYYFSDEKELYLVAPGDHVELAEKILHVVQKPDLAEQIGRNGRAAIMRNFSNVVQAHEVGRLIQTIVENR